MNRTEKKSLVEGMHATFNDSQVVIVAHYKGLTVSEVSNLRNKIRAAGASIKVSKNLLVKIALKDTKFAQISDMFVGPTAFATANDPVSAAKILVEFAKDNEKLVVVGGAFGDRALDKKEIEMLSKLPSLNELRAKIVGMIQTPATRIAGILQAPAGQVARVIGAHARQG